MRFDRIIEPVIEIFLIFLIYILKFNGAIFQRNERDNFKRYVYKQFSMHKWVRCLCGCACRYTHTHSAWVYCVCTRIIIIIIIIINNQMQTKYYSIIS